MLLHCTPPACTKSRARTGSAVRRGAVRSANPTLHERGGGGRGSFPGHLGGAGGLRACGSVCWAARKAESPPSPSVATTADGAKGGSQGAGARRQACAGRLGPAWGSHFHPASGPSPAASSCSLRQNLAAPKLRRDHRITDGGGLRSAAKGLARAKSWTASPASEAPRPPGSAPWLAMGRAPALGRAAAPQPNLPANLPTLYGLLGHHKTP